MYDRQSSGIPPPWKGRKYKRIHHENLDAVLKELGVNAVSRKLVGRVPIAVRLIKQQDEYVWREEIPFKTHEIVFRENVEFTQQRALLRNNVRAIMRFEGEDNCRLVHNQMGDPRIEIINDFTEDELVQ
ncbi:fatty acid-binding protein-like isoform X2 [Culicoides brevitarsis]